MTEAYNNDLWYYRDRPTGFISRPYATRKKKPPKQVKIKLDDLKQDLIVTNKVMRKKESAAKRTITTVTSENEEFTVSGLAEKLNKSYHRISMLIAGVESLTINGVDYTVVVKDYSVDVYKDGVLYKSNIMIKDAAKIMGSGTNYIKDLKRRGKPNKEGWSVKDWIDE